MEAAVTLEEVKQYMKMDADYDREDDLLKSLIFAAQTYCEKYTGLAFTPRQLELHTTKRSTELLYGPVNSIVSVKTFDGVDMSYTKLGRQYPSIITSGECVVTYLTGYTPETLPEQLKTAVKMLVATLHNNRESHGIIEKGELVQMPIGVTALLKPYSRSGGLFL